MKNDIECIVLEFYRASSRSVNFGNILKIDNCILNTYFIKRL